MKMSGTSIRRATGLVALLALGCSDAVTDPSRAGFEANPRIIEGAWATLITTGTATQRFDAELTPAGGVFLGRFDLLHTGQVIQLFFSDGMWDGTTLEFRAETPVGGTAIDLNWTARYVPAADELPDRLLLVSDLFLVPIQYVRPGDLPEGTP
jgi:hypothetical protein